MVQPRWASSGRTSPIARVMVERSTPNQQASTSVGGAMAEVNQCGQEPVDEHELVLRAGADSPPSWTRGKCRLVSLVPQRPDLRDEFGDDL